MTRPWRRRKDDGEKAEGCRLKAVDWRQTTADKYNHENSDIVAG